MKKLITIVITLIASFSIFGLATAELAIIGAAIDTAAIIDTAIACAVIDAASSSSSSSNTTKSATSNTTPSNSVSTPTSSGYARITKIGTLYYKMEDAETSDRFYVDEHGLKFTESLYWSILTINDYYKYEITEDGYFNIDIEAIIKEIESSGKNVLTIKVYEERPNGYYYRYYNFTTSYLKPTFAAIKTEVYKELEIKLAKEKEKEEQERLAQISEETKSRYSSYF